MSAYDGLSETHKSVVDEFFVCGLNQTEAVRRTGRYSKKWPRQVASRIFARDDVKAAVAERKAKLAENAGIAAERVIEELARLAFSNMLDYVEIGADGRPRLNLANLSSDKAAAIQALVVNTGHVENGSAPPVLKVRFKLADKRGALVDLGRHLGLFKERGPGDPAKPANPMELTDLEAARRIAFLLTKATRKD
jgi:phage terminase small subunit